MAKNTLRHSSFRSRLFAGLGLILTFLALAVSFLFSFISTKNSIETEKISNQILLERITSQIDSLYSQMNIAATSITKNPTLKQIVLDLNTMGASQSREYMEQLSQERTINTILGNMMFSPTISNVLLYNREKNYFYYTGTYLGDSRLTEEALARSNAAELLKQRDVFYARPSQSTWISSDWPVISALRCFSNNTTTQDTIVEIQVPAAQLDHICTQKSFEGEKEFLILDKAGNLLYPYDRKPEILKEDKNQDILNAVAEGSEADYRFSYSYLSAESEETGYRVVLVSNNAAIRQQIRSYFVTSLITTLAILGVMLLIIYKVLELVTKPLNQLIGYVGQISLDDDMKLELPSNSLDEFEILNTSMTQMVTNLKKSIHEIYESQLRESNANLAALQAQIDPHFMYNALNSISAASEVYGSEMTTKLCQHFSSMMRYVTSGRQTVTLIEELNHTENYLEFMSLSNENNFSYTLNAEPALNHLPVPKLSIQPIVENCFKHGFSSVSPPWHISISCGSDGPGLWEIVIEDNGCGFSEEALVKLEGLPRAYHELEINGLGLHNTFSRFSIQFMGDFSYEIVNLHPGSRITLKGALHK